MTDDLGNALNQSYFPAAQFINPDRASVITGPRKQYTSASRPRLRRDQLTTYTLPGGAQVTIPIGSRLPSGYAQAEGQPTGNLTTPYSRSAVSNAPLYFGGAEDYAKGFGQVSRPVLPDFSGYVPQRQEPLTPTQFGTRAVGNILSAPLRFASRGIMSGLGLAYNAMNSLQNPQQNQPQEQSIQSQNFYAYNPSPVPMQPRRYFGDY